MRHHSAPLANEQGAPPWYRPHQFEAGHPPLHLLQRQHGPPAPGAISEAMHDSFVLSQPLATPSSVDSSWSSVSEAAARAHASDGGNAGIDSEKDQCIRVAVRVRPLSDLEQSRSDPSAVTVFNDRRTLQLPCADGKVISPMTFDVVEDETVSQEQVFHECGVIELMHQALNGFASTAFAFGQTGSGKTFTMTGPDGVRPNSQSPLRGIIPRALEFIFAVVNHDPAVRYTIRAAYLEIYNESVRDLLNPAATNLSVRYTQEKGFYVENLFVVECEVIDDCMAVLEEGLRNRRSAAHALNEHSSRSHSIMTLYVDSEARDPEDGRPLKKFGKVSFVDLAGSERVKESKTAGDMLTEAHNINKSLLTLGKCISALADPKKRAGHIPYRDSKLTKLLSDSLGGNGLALMNALRVFGLCCFRRPGAPRLTSVSLFFRPSPRLWHVNINKRSRAFRPRRITWRKQ